MMRQDAKGEPFRKYAKFFCGRPGNLRKRRFEVPKAHEVSLKEDTRKKSSLDPGKLFAYLIEE